VPYKVAPGLSFWGDDPGNVRKVPDAGPTNPHTSLHLSGGLRVQRQVAGTNGEAPTEVGASICLAVSVGGLQKKIR
jgi:hypothetical protein